MRFFPKYKVGDTVKYRGRQGTVVEVFLETKKPVDTYRYYVKLRTGIWSTTESYMELIKTKEDVSEPITD